MFLMTFLKNIFGRKKSKPSDKALPSPDLNPAGLSAEAYKLIVEYEVGGGQRYYDRFLRHPSYPGGASGVTIGIGYDLGYKALSTFKKDWGPYLSSADMQKLGRCIGKKRGNAKSALRSVRSITINWDDAEKVFQNVTLPRFAQRTRRAFPGSDKLHPTVFGVLVSLVFNRGGSMRGSTRSEMAKIRNIIENDTSSRSHDKIAYQIRSMKRLWRNKGLDGLLVRRDAEALMIENV